MLPSTSTNRLRWDRSLVKKSVCLQLKTIAPALDHRLCISTRLDRMSTCVGSIITPKAIASFALRKGLKKAPSTKKEVIGYPIAFGPRQTSTILIKACRCVIGQQAGHLVWSHSPSHLFYSDLLMVRHEMPINSVKGSLIKAGKQEVLVRLFFVGEGCFDCSWSRLGSLIFPSFFKDWKSKSLR